MWSLDHRCPIYVRITAVLIKFEQSWVPSVHGCNHCPTQESPFLSSLPHPRFSSLFHSSSGAFVASVQYYSLQRFWPLVWFSCSSGWAHTSTHTYKKNCLENSLNLVHYLKRGSTELREDMLRRRGSVQGDGILFHCRVLWFSRIKKKIAKVGNSICLVNYWECQVYISLTEYISFSVFVCTSSSILMISMVLSSSLMRTGVSSTVKLTQESLISKTLYFPFVEIPFDLYEMSFSPWIYQLLHK